MRTGRMLLVLSVGVLGLTSWLTRDAAWWAPLRQSLGQLGAQGERALAVAGPPAAAPRKCVSATGVLYTTDPACPPGSREQAASGGTVNVLPAVRPAVPPASAASAQPLLRQLADPQGSADLQAKRLEKVVGQ